MRQGSFFDRQRGGGGGAVEAGDGGRRKPPRLSRQVNADLHKKVKTEVIQDARERRVGSDDGRPLVDTDENTQHEPRGLATPDDGSGEKAH